MKLLRRTVAAAAVMLIASNAQAQNLFVSDVGSGNGSGNIYDYAPGGVQSTFASGVDRPFGLAFNSAGDLFVSANPSGIIYEYTPGGVKSTFASGLIGPGALAVNSAGDVFVGNGTSLTEITPGGMQSTFASGLEIGGLAFNSAGTLFEADYGSDSINEFTPGGVESTFASGGLDEPIALTFQPTPEPSTLGLIVVGATALLVRRRKLVALLISDSSGD
jgi:DNA-binding beta-propeller fold protein YncE